MVVVRARCGCSERSEQRIARHSHFSGRLVWLFPKSGSAAREAREQSHPHGLRNICTFHRQRGSFTSWTEWRPGGVHSTAVIPTDTPLKILDTGVRQPHCQLLWSRILSLEINAISARSVSSFTLLLNAELSALMERENLGANVRF